MADVKSKHQELAGVVKAVHAQLRNKLHKGDGDHEKIWTEHCQDSTTLSEYATAMHSLATDIWRKQHTVTRIEWCQQTCLQYFHGGGLHKTLEKDRRRKHYQEQRRVVETSPDSSQTLGLERNGEGCRGEEDQNVGGVGTGSDSLEGDSVQEEMVSISTKEEQPEPGELQLNTVTLPFEGQIRLLDVGSCYNPFINMENFLAVGIDISPAIESVFNCDFLHLDITGPMGSSQCMDTHIHSLRSPIETLPAQLFHCVVFSLLLEYLPSPSQRWNCCQKAHQLLMWDGLLVIVSPDSHNQTRSAQWMRSWRTALESLGFARWRYEKLEHLHCMAFRKVQRDPNEALPNRGGPDMMYIPQDFHDTEDKMENTELCYSELKPEVEDVCQELFEEHPDL